MDSFSIVIPCYNEPLEAVVNTIHILRGEFGKQEVLIAENGSNLLRHLPMLFDYMKLIQRNEKGLGWALREGIRNASNEIVVFLPADLSYDLDFVPRALGQLVDGADVVLGSKIHPESKVERPLSRQILSWGYGLWVNIRHQVPSTDITGTKAWKRSKVLPLLGECPSDGIQFEVELMKASFRRGLKVKEVPVIVKDFRLKHFA